MRSIFIPILNQVAPQISRDYKITTRPTDYKSNKVYLEENSTSSRNPQCRPVSVLSRLFSRSELSSIFILVLNQLASSRSSGYKGTAKPQTDDQNWNGLS
ncbi:hypothetical protein BaRGS_00039292 [Batillaria attramentaria]|uniref:Uncharacterized protein n=1 Tax=Batillaria attramentaria TaxID=370345 RepID=A0ABD0J3G0_9CAEN